MDRPPLEKTPRNVVLWNTARRLAALMNIDLEETETGGGSDGNLTSPFAATLDGLGGVGDGAHALHEFIYLDKLSERTALLTLLLATGEHPQ
jgi:glutamate carboxypeptidase